MIEHIQLEGSPLWFAEHTVYVGCDGNAYETEAEALQTYGVSGDGHAEWLDAATLADESRRLVLDRFVYDR